MTDDERKQIREKLALMGINSPELVDSVISRQEEMEKCLLRALGEDLGMAHFQEMAALACEDEGGGEAQQAKEVTSCDG